MSELKGLEKDRDMSQDEPKRALDQLQKLTDSFTADVEQIAQVKKPNSWRSRIFVLANDL